MYFCTQVSNIDVKNTFVTVIAMCYSPHYYYLLWAVWDCSGNFGVNMNLVYCVYSTKEDKFLDPSFLVALSDLYPINDLTLS